MVDLEEEFVKYERDMRSLGIRVEKRDFMAGVVLGINISDKINKKPDKDKPDSSVNPFQPEYIYNVTDNCDDRPKDCRYRMHEEEGFGPRSGCDIGGCNGVFGALCQDLRSK